MYNFRKAVMVVKLDNQRILTIVSNKIILKGNPLVSRLFYFLLKRLEYIEFQGTVKGLKSTFKVQIVRNK